MFPKEGGGVLQLYEDDLPISDIEYYLKIGVSPVSPFLLQCGKI